MGEVQTPGSPNRQGFRYAFGFDNRVRAQNYYPDTLFRNEQSVEIAANRNNQQDAYSQDLVTDDAVRFLERNYRSPFFLYVGYSSVHANNALGDNAPHKIQVPSLAPYNNEDWPEAQKAYAAAITRVRLLHRSHLEAI